MAQGEVADDLQEDAQGHRRDAEAMVSDGSHRYQPRDHYRQEAGICEVCIDALHGTEPEEADEEEGDATDDPEE